MSISFSGNGSDGGVFALGPAANQFIGATRVDAEALRDNYASANQDWLAQYDANPALGIILNYQDGGQDTLVGQVRTDDTWSDVPGVFAAGGSDLSNVPNNSIPIRNAAGQYVGSPVTMSGELLTSTAPIKLPGGGALEFDNNDMSSGGTVTGGAAGVRFNNNSDDTSGYLISVPFVTATGSGTPFYDAFGPEIVAPSLADKSDLRDAEFDFVNPFPGIVTEYTVSRAAGSPTLTNCNFIIWLEGYDTGVPLFDFKESNPGGSGFDLVAGENVVTTPVPIGFPANLNDQAPANEQIRLYSRVVDSDGNLIQLEGQVVTIPSTINPITGLPDPRAEQQWLPFLGRRVHFSTKTDIATVNDIPTTTMMYEKIKSTLVAGNGISITADDSAETLTIAGMGQTPVTIHGFSIDIPSTVDVGTDLNVEHTIRYTIQSAASFSSLSLIVVVGDNKPVTLPTMDGTTTQAITLSAIDTSAPATVNFHIQGTLTAGGTISSNTQTITVRAQLPQELAYYDARPTNDFVTADLTGMTSVDVAPAGTMFEIREAVINTGYLGILMPANRDAINIQELTFDLSATDRFTKQTNARQIGGQEYHLYTLQNNSGFNGSFNYRVDT